MFRAAQLAPVPYVEPWAADIDSRIAALTARPRRIAYFYEKPDTGTFRYRVFNMAKALAARAVDDTSASWFENCDLSQTERFIDRADALVICRTRYTPALERMINRATARGTKVIFDIDDLVYDTDYLRLVMATLDQDPASEATLDIWFAMFSRLGATLRLCDRAVTTNQFLAQRLREFVPGMHVDIIPNFLNETQQAISTRLYNAKARANFLSDGRIHIGYFSGTPTHNRDFQVVVPALEKLFEEDSRLVLRIVGYLDNCSFLDRFANRVEIYPLQDFVNLQRLIAEVEINVVPLQDNTFTNCKSELKYFEAAIAGTITIASPTHVFRQVIAPQKDGFLAKADEWGQVLRETIHLALDGDRYAAVARAGFEKAESTYGWNRLGDMIVAAIFPQHAA